MSQDAPQIVLRHMLAHGSTSAPQLLEDLGMPQFKASRTIRRLLALKLIEHTGYGPRKPCARPPRLFGLTLAGQVEASKPLKPPRPPSKPSTSPPSPRNDRTFVGYGQGIGRFPTVWHMAGAMA